LNLTPDQQQVACACGITFVPASVAQVQRLTMQRRIFPIDEQPFLATRSAGFYETYGTLMRLVEEYQQGRQRRPVQGLVPSGEAAPAASHEPALQVPVEEEVGLVATAPSQQQGVIKVIPRRRRAARSEAEPAPEVNQTEVTHEAPGPARPAGAVELLSPEDVGSETKCQVVEDQPIRLVRRPRIRHPQPPRWTTAGKARRGRLK
jgi:hypothetical protein